MHDDHDPGLAHDLHTLDRRRRVLTWLAGSAGLGGAIALFGCGGGSAGTSGSSDSAGSSSGGSSSTGGSTTTTTASCAVIPEETNGPYPADGSNSAGNGGIANVLLTSGIVRSDIRSSFGGSSSTVAGGVPLTVTLKLVNAGTGASTSCADLAGYAIYIWHCDREGRYSMYSSGVTNENYLRGVQVTGADGTATFTTVFPACYSGRMPHIHIEIYASAAAATGYTKALKTTQLAFPTDVCNTVYNNASGYGASISNFARISFSSDMVFSDGVTQELSTVAGDLANGYTATLTVGISA